MSAQTSEPGAPGFFCRDSSLAAGEPLFGTATRADVWLMLEYTGAWGKKAFEESALPDPVKAHLSRYLDASPHARVQLIRQPGRGADGIAFFVAVTREPLPAVYEFHLRRYEDLLSLDLAAVADGAPAYAQRARRTPLYLVCVNGRRDRCCARRGVGVYEAIAAQVGDAAWESTHIGGHRFAAVGMCFPHGVCYGRLEPGDAPEVVRAYRAGRIFMEKYRGRACHDAITQAADYWLRVETGVAALEAFRWLGTESVSGEAWVARFGDAANGQVHRIQVEAAQSGARVYTSCGDAEPSAFVEYRLAAHSLEEPDAP